MWLRKQKLSKGKRKRFCDRGIVLRVLRILSTKKTLVSVLTVLLISVVVFAPKTVYCDSPWHSKEWHISYFKDLCDAHPSLASYESVGKTYEGRDIMMFKIGNPDGARVLWDAQLHGNEHYTSEILDLIGEWLFSGDPYATQILQNNYVLIIPVINLDSYDRSNANHEQCRYGVDLNRNFERGWSSSSCSSSQTYSGPYAASEKETQTLRNVFKTYRPVFYVNLHQGASGAPFSSYYSSGDTTLANQVRTRATEVAGELGTTLWRVGRMGSSGFAIGDAYTYGDIPSPWLFEVDPRWTHTNAIWQDLVNKMYPNCLAMFIAMCEISAGQTFPETPPSYYNLEIRSSPIANVGFTIDGQVETTPYSENLEQGGYTVVMPGSISVSSETYIFDQWQDASTSRTRTIYLNADTRVTAIYELVETPSYYNPQLFGWGGISYGGTSGYNAIEPMLDELQAEGWNCFRYYSVPTWAQPRWGTSDINYNILSHLCDEAKERGMYIFLNIAHNFPTGTYIDGHRDEWINGYLADLNRINAKNRDNIILELTNEYTGSQSSIIAHYNAMIAALRAEGYTQTIQLNYWWDHDIGYCTRQVDDPLNNFMVGMHHYAQSKDFDDYNTPGTFTEVCQNSGIEDYLQNSIWPDIIKPVLDAGVDYCCTELGTGWDYKYTRGGVAFCMRFLQLAEEDGRVHAVMHRWQPGGPSYETDYDDYYERAQEYFGMSFFQKPPTVDPSASADLNNDGSVDILDITIVAYSISSVPGDPRWNPNADLNKDGNIDLLDVVIVATNFSP